MFKELFLHGRGLDAPPGIMGGGTMEINTVPRFDSVDGQEATYSKLPRLQFPADDIRRVVMVLDVTDHFKSALFDEVRMARWRLGIPDAPPRSMQTGSFCLSVSPRRIRHD